MINDANADRDAITGLRAPTNFGRPNWTAVFRSIRKIHAPGEAGTFFCGPKGLGSQLHLKCNEYSDPGMSLKPMNTKMDYPVGLYANRYEDYQFRWGKENF
jgi:NADPH oxidase 2